MNLNIHNIHNIHNMYKGTIPTQIGLMTNIVSLDLHQNLLTGILIFKFFKLSFF